MGKELSGVLRKGAVDKAQAPLTDAMGALTLNATWAVVMSDARQFKGGLPSVMSEAERPFVHGYMDTMIAPSPHAF